MTNEGSIRSSNGVAVSIISGVTLTNDITAVINGYSGIYVGNASATAANPGDIAALGANGL